MHEACTGTCAQGCLAKLKLGFGIHGATLLTPASHIKHILRVLFWPLRTRQDSAPVLWLNYLFLKQNSLPQGLLLSPELCPGMVWGGHYWLGQNTSSGSS